MKVPFTWLREHCDPGLDVDAVASALSLSGTEVERVTRVGVPSGDGNAALFRIGKVVSAEPHPDAERLRVCSVQLAGSDMRTVVCGAPNVAAGEVVLVALPGAVLPDGRRLARADLRGVRSDGMILSETEVELGADSERIMVLSDSYEVGEAAERYLTLGDDVIELEVNPNRPDCLSVYGVARELHAVTGAPLGPDPSSEDAPAEADGEIADLVTVAIDDPEVCLRFSARVFTDVQIGPSPQWLKARLIAAGQRPINNVVDTTNYVMLLLGQPMHAYDLDRLEGGELRVRRAREGEQLVTLDGEQRCFDDDAALVCDAKRARGIGGIMGGADSEVSDATTRVVLEAATWVGPNVLTTSSKLALRTEASARFEKQLHPELALRAQRLASRLMVELCGARMVPGTADVAPGVPDPNRVTLRSRRIEQLVGEAVPLDEAAAILERLGFAVERGDATLEAEVPFFRHYDVTREADLVEEVVRVHGLSNLPETLPSRRRAIGGLTREQKLRRTAQDLLRARGLNEIVSYSFIAPDFVDRLRLPEGDYRRRVLRIANPLSEDQSAMRTTLAPGLLEAARRNLDRDVASVRLFESGRIFIFNGQERLPNERLHLGFVLAGAWELASWRHPERTPDFYVVKGLLSNLMDALGVEWRLAGGGPSFLHPGRAAEVLTGGHEAGWLGEVHPLVASAFGIERPTALLELDLDTVLASARGTATYEDVITYPAVFEDIAVVVDEAVEAQTVADAVRSGAGPELRSAQAFDLYRGEQIGEGRKSIALRLEFRAADRTLTDEEVAAIRKRIGESLARELDAEIRGAS